MAAEESNTEYILTISNFDELKSNGRIDNVNIAELNHKCKCLLCEQS